MSEVKICGITQPEDIDSLNALKPDYAGFVFAPSKRQVNVSEAKNLIQNLDPVIKSVGVFVDESIHKVKDIAEQCNLDILQFHGNESPKYCGLFMQEVWKSFRVKDTHSLKEIAAYQVNGILLDAYHPKMYGGSGSSFNWHILEQFDTQNKFIIAGGLTSDNVSQCIYTTKPDVVDVSSGVETNGSKDALKILEFIRKVREEDE